MARKSGLPFFHDSLVKLLGDKALPPKSKVPPTNVVQPLPMPQIDLSKEKDYSGISLFKNGVLQITADAANVEGVKKLLDDWKKQNKLILDTYGNLAVDIETKPDGSFLITANVPGQFQHKAKVSPPNVLPASKDLVTWESWETTEALQAPDPLLLQAAQELEQQIINVSKIPAKFFGKVHDEYIFTKPEYIGEWAPPEDNPVTKDYVNKFASEAAKAQNALTEAKAKNAFLSGTTQNPCKEILLKPAAQVMHDTNAQAHLIAEGQKLADDPMKYKKIFSVKEEQKAYVDPKEMPNYVAQELAYVTHVLSKMAKEELSAEDKLYQALTSDEKAKMNAPATKPEKLKGLMLDSVFIDEAADFVELDPDVVAKLNKNEEPEEVELVELTISGLTKKEAEAMLKQVKKSEKPVLVSKKKMKDIGTGSKAIVKWEFESSSMVSNGTPVKYIAQLNEDGTLSCQCRGWTQGSAKSAEGRFCKHTKALAEQYDMKTLFKRWKRGEPLGEDFVQDGQQAPELKPIGTSTAPTYTSKRVVEI